MHKSCLSCQTQKLAPHRIMVKNSCIFYVIICWQNLRSYDFYQLSDCHQQLPTNQITNSEVWQITSFSSIHRPCLTALSQNIIKLWIKISYGVKPDLTWKLETNFAFITLQTSRWKIYTTYCQNYDASEAYLKQKMKKKKEFCNFLNVSVNLETKIM